MSGVPLSSNNAQRELVERQVNRYMAAILSVNDTLSDPNERERMRRAVLDSGELLMRRIWEQFECRTA